MAGNSQNKFNQTNAEESSHGTEQRCADILASSTSSPFTPEQKQILGNVYRLILGWRHDRLLKSKQAPKPISSAPLPVKRES